MPAAQNQTAKGKPRASRDIVAQAAADRRKSTARIGAPVGHVTSKAKRAALEAIRDSIPGNACLTQEQRLLEALPAWSVDTFEASRFLDVYYPPARVMALRRKGHNIVTTWKYVPTESGRLHRIGVYALAKGVQP